MLSRCFIIISTVFLRPSGKRSYKVILLSLPLLRSIPFLVTLFDFLRSFPDLLSPTILRLKKSICIPPNQSWNKLVSPSLYTGECQALTDKCDSRLSGFRFTGCSADLSETSVGMAPSFLEKTRVSVAPCFMEETSVSVAPCLVEG
jgi:hypothetical protein